jgi:DNA-binding beta-propeller fold protein YncE
LIVRAALALTLLGATAEAADPPNRIYTLYVCAESDDTVHKIRFGPNGFEELRRIEVGAFPTEIEGPHGISVSPDGKHWFVSLSHGLPFGSIHKFDTEKNEYLADVMVGMFPATMWVSPSTRLLYVVNFDLYGDMEPSTLSVVETATMIEVARIPTGIMPHGVRMDGNGTRVYSVNMMSDSLVEADAMKFEIARTLSLLDPKEEAAPAGEHHEHGAAPAGGGDPLLTRMSTKVKPTWATQPTPRGAVYVAGNGNHQILEIDLEKWKVSRRFDAGAGMGPYNMDLTSDGKLLVATYKAGARVGFWDLETGRELARVPTTRPVPHGVAITDDDRYAFVSVEGVGGEPGTVEVFDLRSRERVGKLDVGKQAGGIAFWKAEP